MKELLWLIPALPFAGAFILITMGTRLSRTIVSMIGAGTVWRCRINHDPHRIRVFVIFDTNLYTGRMELGEC